MNKLGRIDRFLSLRMYEPLILADSRAADNRRSAKISVPAGSVNQR